MIDPTVPPSGVRRFETRGNWWAVRELDGQLAFEIATLPPLWIDAPRPLEEMSDAELEQLLRAELEPK